MTFLFLQKLFMQKCFIFSEKLRGGMSMVGFDFLSGLLETAGKDVVEGLVKDAVEDIMHKVDESLQDAKITVDWEQVDEKTLKLILTIEKE